MFLITPIAVTLFSFGPSVSAVAYAGPSSGYDPSLPPVELSMRWRDTTEHPQDMAFLSWHTRLSEFAGREKETGDLEEWANGKPAISIKFIIGEGGVGKSRLAAEFAEVLKGWGWAAGFIDLRRPQQFPLKKKGTLLIVDYPEEDRGGVAELLRDLANMESGPCRLRVLFLTRGVIGDWDEAIQDSHAVDLLDNVPIELGRLSGPAAHKLYLSALGEVSEIEGTYPPSLSETDLTSWLNQSPENDLALFVLAVAVHSALHPDDPVVTYKGREVVEALADRERHRLRGIAEERGAASPDVFARVLAMAAIADELQMAQIAAFADDRELELGFSSGADIRLELEAAGLLGENLVRAPKPDIVAAAFLVRTLSRKPESAPKLLWAALAGDLRGGLERLARLSHDAEVVLGVSEHRIRSWLAEAAGEDLGRCSALVGFFRDTPPLAWLDAAICARQALLEVSSDDEARSWLLNDLSNDLDEAGDSTGALEAIREAVEIRRRLAGSDAARYEGHLAASLNNLAIRLTSVGKREGVLEAIREATEIYRRLARADAVTYDPLFASSLINLSNGLDQVGDGEGALEAIREAVEILRRLSEANPARHEPKLAIGLSNLAGCLRGGDGALEAIRESVEVHRRLVGVSPALYEPKLATGLNNLSISLMREGDGKAVLEAIQESVEILRRLAGASAARYEPELARSLGTLGMMLRALELRPQAAAALGEGCELIRPYAGESPDSPHADLLAMLESDLKKAQDAE